MINKKKPKNYYLYAGILVLFAALFITIYFSMVSMPKGNVSGLPFYGEAGGVGEEHFIDDFFLTDQNGNSVSLANFKESIFIADFIFTTCSGICPIMSTQMERIQEAFNADDEIKIASFTVDPDYDTPQILKEYAIGHKANNKQWFFLTGSKKEIYKLARYSFIVDASIGDGGERDFVHTNKFALIDKNLHIRGYYDGTDSIEVTKLIEDIKRLKKENK